MSASVNLTSLADVKSYLNVTGSTHDALLQALIGRVSEAVESRCGRRFGQATVTEYHDGRGRPRVVLERRPVSSITSLHDDVDRLYGSDRLVPAGRYALRPAAGIVELLSGAFQDGTRNVKVVYQAGYAAVPADLAHAAVLWVAACFNRARQGADGLAEERLDEYAARYAAAAAPPDVEGILDAYRETKV